KCVFRENIITFSSISKFSLVLTNKITLYFPQMERPNHILPATLVLSRKRKIVSEVAFSLNNHFHFRATRRLVDFIQHDLYCMETVFNRLYCSIILDFKVALFPLVIKL